jgi:hypothetical protein
VNGFRFFWYVKQAGNKKYKRRNSLPQNNKGGGGTPAKRISYIDVANVINVRVVQFDPVYVNMFASSAKHES